MTEAHGKYEVSPSEGRLNLGIHTSSPSATFEHKDESDLSITGADPDEVCFCVKFSGEIVQPEDVDNTPVENGLLFFENPQVAINLLRSIAALLVDAEGLDNIADTLFENLGRMRDQGKEPWVMSSFLEARLAEYEAGFDVPDV